MHLSLVIPAYNEENRIGPTLSRIYGFMAEKGYKYEVMVVDDGSSDATVREANRSELAKVGKLRVIQNGINRGKGFSVRNGITQSKGMYILFTDADLSTPIEEIDKFFACAAHGYDVVVGSRALSESIVVIHQPWYREGMGKIFNLFVKLILMKEFNDTQCGFKLFKGDVAREIARRMKIDGFCFAVEMLYLAKIKGYNIKEKGVLWNNSPESKVRLFSSSVGMFFDLMKIRI
ncbi:MAG: glycosyltransferase family 2 protein, partial [Candidatus Omnitrophica bacterium]|nr:glycosyltransferase family 2 protein [Candidatus Omnitrophota bacterium]